MEKSAHTMTIAGESIATAETLDVIDPATGRPFARAPVCTPELLERALESAERAFSTWRRDEAARRSALAAAADAVQAAAEPLAKLLSQEQGKPLRFATREVLGVIGTLRYHTKLPIPVEQLPSDGSARIELRRKPYGVVAAITPWNFPLLIASNKLAPALLAGNAVVLKPSPYTPLS